MSVVHVNEENFEEIVLKADGPVLVDFWAEWCGPCQMIAPVLETIAEEMPELTVAKVNVDSNMSLAQQYNVVSIPMLLLIKNGEVVKKTIGAMPKEEIMEFITK